MLASVAVVALATLAVVWSLAHPAKDTLWYEIVKTGVQVLGVAVIGGVVSIAVSSWEQARQRMAEGLERQREEFGVRAALLERAAHCGQRMYVTCQHARRARKDLSNKNDDGESERLATALTLLDHTYLEFSANARALQTEIGARYGIRLSHNAEDQQGESYLLWHQIADLLTVYYFNLHGNFRTNVLSSNSITSTELHSGLDLCGMVEDPRNPTAAELDDMQERISTKFEEAMPKLANAMLEGQLRDV